jgi:hypothetical protein
VRRSASKKFILFIIGCAVNIILFSLSKYLKFPLWLDFTGSFYITAVCGPLPGAVSFIIHITLLAVLIDGVGALWLALPMLFAAAVIYTAKHFFLLGKPLYHVCTVFLSSLAASVGYFVIFIANQLPARYESYRGALNAVAESHGRLLGALLPAIAISFAEMIPCLSLFTAMYFLTPRPKSSLSFKK